MKVTAQIADLHMDDINILDTWIEMLTMIISKALLVGFLFHGG